MRIGTRSTCTPRAPAGRLLPAEEALEFSIEYGGVVVFGNAFVVDDPDEAEGGLQLLLDKYAPHLRPGRDYRPITAGELKRTSVFRLDIESWSGKRKCVEPDFRGRSLSLTRESERRVRRPLDDLLLQGVGEIAEVVAVASDAHDQVAM
jgi:hypothetical protein